MNLLKSSGADQVIVSASSAGRMLGMAAEHPAADMVNDLLIFGNGHDIVERPVRPEEIGKTRNRSETVVSVVRNGKHLKLNDPEVGALRAGDKVVSIQENSDLFDTWFYRNKAIQFKNSLLL